MRIRETNLDERLDLLENVGTGEVFLCVDILSLLKHGRFWYPQEQLAIASLMFSTPKVDAPTLRMLMAALISRS